MWRRPSWTRQIYNIIVHVCHLEQGWQLTATNERRFFTRLPLIHTVRFSFRTTWHHVQFTSILYCNFWLSMPGRPNFRSGCSNRWFDIVSSNVSCIPEKNVDQLHLINDYTRAIVKLGYRHSQVCSACCLSTYALYVKKLFFYSRVLEFFFWTTQNKIKTSFL